MQKRSVLRFKNNERQGKKIKFLKAVNGGMNIEPKYVGKIEYIMKHERAFTH